MTGFTGWLLLAALPLLPLSLTLFNLATWRRGRDAPVRARWRISVLIPARNEARHIVRCVRAAAQSDYPVEEIVVCDDHSTDATPALLAELCGEIPQLRWFRGAPLPSGWVGKPHACHQLAQEARGDLLVFVDADTTLEPRGLSRFVSAFDEGRAELASAVPRQRMGSFAERLMMPLLLLTYTSWLPLRLVAATRDPRLAAANGQLLGLTRRALERLGGFASVGGEMVDDVALCRRAKRCGLRVDFFEGSAMASCRMYDSGRALWRGFSKNLYEGIGATPGALLGVVALHLGCFVLPYAGLLAALTLEAAQAWFWPALSGAMANLALRTALVVRFRQPPEGVLLHPLAVLALCALAFNSYRWYTRGQLRWAGRVYPAREHRLEVAP